VGIVHPTPTPTDIARIRDRILKVPPGFSQRMGRFRLFCKKRCHTIRVSIPFSEPFLNFQPKSLELKMVLDRNTALEKVLVFLARS